MKALRCAKVRFAEQRCRPRYTNTNSAAMASWCVVLGMAGNSRSRLGNRSSTRKFEREAIRFRSITAKLGSSFRGILPVVQEDFISRILLGEYRDDLSIAYYSKEIAFACELEGARAVLVVEYQYLATIPSACHTWAPIRRKRES